MPAESISDRRPTPGFYADPAGLNLTGLERHGQLIRGQGEPPAVQHLTGLRPTEISMGRATFAMPASGWLAGPVGFLSAGPIGFLADAPLSLAIDSLLPAGKASTTSEILLT